MDFSFTDDQEALGELARKILADRCTLERLTRVEASEERLDRELWAELAKANLLGASLPEAFGGSGFGLVELCLLLEEVGRAVAPVPVWATLALGALPIEAFGSEAQKRRWLPGVVAGEVFLSGALTDADTDDPMKPTTAADRDGKGWRLVGRKICVPAAHLAERLLVPALTGEGRVAIFLVDPRASGVTLERQEVTNHEPQFQITLSAVPVSTEDVLADPSRGEQVLGWMLARAVVGLCAMQVGVCDRALRLTAEYTSDRKQFDRPIGSFQAVHQRAADAYIDVESMRLTLWQAAFRLGEEALAAREVAIAKFWAADAGHRVVYAAQHLHGGIGIDVDYPLHRYTLWAKQIELTLGSSSRQLERLGEELARSSSRGGSQTA